MRKSNKQAPDAVLNEVRRFVKYLMWVPDEYAAAMSVILALSNVRSAFTSVPLALVTSVHPKTGKTTFGVKIPLMLADHPFKVTKSTTEPAMMNSFVDGDGTIDGAPNWVVDDAGKFFGTSGLNGHTSKAYGILVDSYLDIAKQTVSVNRVPTEFPAMMTAFVNGLNKAVPADLETRTVHFRLKMKPPEMRMPDASSKAVRNEAADLKEALHGWARSNMSFFREFMTEQVLHVHPKLTDRLMETWGPMFAVAYAAGGQWPQWIMDAFLLMGLDAAEKPAVFGYQQALLDTAKVITAWDADRIFAADLVPELRKLPEGDRYREADNNYLVDNLLQRALGDRQELRGRSLAGQMVRGEGWLAEPILEAAAELYDELHPVPDAAGPTSVQKALTLTAVRP